MQIRSSFKILKNLKSNLKPKKNVILCRPTLALL